MTHRIKYVREITVLVAVSLIFPAMANAGSGGRGKSGRTTARSSRSRSSSPRQKTSRRAYSRRSSSGRQSISRRSSSPSRRHRGVSSRSRAKMSRRSPSHAGRSRKSSPTRRIPRRNVSRRPSASVSSPSHRGPSFSNRAPRTQITPRRVIRQPSVAAVQRPSRATDSVLRSPAVTRDGRSPTTSTRSGSSVLVFNDSGRTRTNFNHTGRTFTRRGDGRDTSATGIINLSPSTNARSDRSVSGRRGGRRFNSGHGATGAPFAGSFFINNNVSRYGRAYDRSDVYHDGYGGRSVRLDSFGLGGHRSGNHSIHHGGFGHSYGHDSYRHAYFDNAYYFGSHYYGRRHHRSHHDVVYYPTYSYHDYGYSYPYGYPSSYPYTFPQTYVGISAQSYYEVDPDIEQVYEDAIAAPDAGTVYLPPVPNEVANARPSAPLMEDAVGAQQAGQQVGQHPIPQAVVDGHQAFARHDLVKARHAYLNAVLADNEDGYAKLFYAMASVSAGEYDVASLALRGALRSASELVTDPIDLRQFYNDEEQVKTDIEALSTFSSLHGDDLESQFLLVYFRYSMGQADEAQRLLMSVDSSVIENDATMKGLRDAVSAVISRSQDQSEQDQP